MPRMGGLELVAQLRAHAATQALPVIVLTSSDLDPDYAAGANGYVLKPVIADQFTAAAQAVGLYWLGLNRRPAGAPNGLNRLP